MELQDFIKKFAEQFDDTDESEIKADTDFTELDEWSSMMTLTIIAMVDEEYDVQIGGADIRKCETVEDLFNLVNSKK